MGAAQRPATCASAAFLMEFEFRRPRSGDTGPDPAPGTAMDESYPPIAMAVSIPRMMASGEGGQPGTATSTGMTLETRPQLA